MDIKTFRTQKRNIEKEIQDKLNTLSDNCGLKLDVQVESISKYSVGGACVQYVHEVFIKAEL